MHGDEKTFVCHLLLFATKIFKKFEELTKNWIIIFRLRSETSAIVRLQKQLKKRCKIKVFFEILHPADFFHPVHAPFKAIKNAIMAVILQKVLLVNKPC